MEDMATESIGSLDYNEIVFPRLGIDITLNPTAFTIGGFSIQWYGILITIGLVLAMIYAFTQVKQYGLNPDRVLDATIGGIIGAIIGARAYYVLLNWSDYAGDWARILDFRGGGLAIYGGLIGGLLLGCLVAKLRRVRVLPLLDVAGIGFLLGQGIGRWGNFFNQEAFGTNTTSLFGMSGGRIQQWIEQVYPNTTYYENFGTSLDASLPVHPCFLYESVWCLLGFALLAIFAKKIRRFDGQIFLIYIGWYGLERAFVESLRTDSLVIGNVRISQLLAILCVVASVLLQIVVGLRVRRLGSDYRLYKDTEESKLLLEADEVPTKKHDTQNSGKDALDAAQLDEEKEESNADSAGLDHQKGEGGGENIEEGETEGELDAVDVDKSDSGKGEEAGGGKIEENIDAADADKSDSAKDDEAEKDGISKKQGE